MSFFDPQLSDFGGIYGGNGLGYDGASTLAGAADDANGTYDFGSSNAAGILFQRDAVEQARMGAAYPQNGQSWDFNAATLGVSRLIDSAARGYATANGSLPGSYAGQNGLTYVNGRNGGAVMLNGNLIPLLLIAGAVFLLMK